MAEFFRMFFLSFSGPLSLVVGFFVVYYTLETVNVDFFVVLTWIVLFAPIWIPVTLYYMTFPRWSEFIDLKFQDKSGRVTLEIKLPQEVFKSPQAMEEVLAQVFNKNKPRNLWQAYWDGKQPLTYSFEIVSTGGSVKFYASLPVKKAKDVFEAQLYAQYPGIEVTQLDIDYTAEIENDPEKWEIMGFHFTKAEDEDVLPIKTYVDYGLDKNPKEEEKVEPLAPILEYLGGIKPDERVWIQILCKSHRKRAFQFGDMKSKSDWTAAAKKKIDEIMQRDDKKIGEAEYEGMPRLTTGERDLITHIERNTSKLAYETAIRVIYANRPGKFNSETISSMTRVLKAAFLVVGRNDITMGWRTDFDYKTFSDPTGNRLKFYKRMELDFYKMRAYVPRDVVNGADRPKVMSVEEIATMWHIPGKAIVTPGVSRVESVRRDAPSNLPIGDQTNSWIN